MIRSLVLWAETYLISSTTLTPNLTKSFGNNNNGQTMVHQLCAIANTCLTAYPTEEGIQSIVCTRLLKVLTRNKDIRKQCAILSILKATVVSLSVVESTAWMDLLTAFSRMFPVFQQMQHKMGRHIAYALCVASDAFKDASKRRQYLAHLLENFQSELSSV